MIANVSLLAPDLSGGGGTRVYLLANVLRQLNYDVTVFGFLFGKCLYPPPPTDLTVKWVTGCHYPQMFFAIHRLLKQIDGDMLYAVKPRPTSFGIALLKHLQTKQPMMLDIDDWELSWFGGNHWQYRPTPRQLAKDILKPDGALRNPQYPLYLKWMEKLVHQANAITVNNRFLQKRYGGTYLPNGKDTTRFDPKKYDPKTSRQKYGLQNYRILMFPGTARPHKGLEDVLLALDHLNQPDLKLVLVGGRDIGDGYIETLMAHWPGWILKLPPVPIEEMPEIVAAAHVIVVPQRNNATALAQFPIKLTDGMAMAKPIISTRIGDIPEILGDTGFLVDPNSPEQITQKLNWIFENLETANEKALQARQRCIHHYSTHRMAEILSPVIQSLQ